MRKLVLCFGLLASLAAPGLAQAGPAGAVGGGVTGAVLGGAVAGPVGAVVGGAGGAYVGDRYSGHRRVFRRPTRRCVVRHHRRYC